jgi:hypothetical protein
MMTKQSGQISKVARATRINKQGDCMTKQDDYTTKQDDYTTKQGDYGDLH